jgi:hypothetical protein
MGPTDLLPLRRKACWGFFRPKNLKASASLSPSMYKIKTEALTIISLTKSFQKKPGPLFSCHTTFSFRGIRVFCVTKARTLGTCRRHVLSQLRPTLTKRPFWILFLLITFSISWHKNKRSVQYKSHNIRNIRIHFSPRFYDVIWQGGMHKYEWFTEVSVDIHLLRFLHTFSLHVL